MDRSNQEERSWGRWISAACDFMASEEGVGVSHKQIVCAILKWGLSGNLKNRPDSLIGFGNCRGVMRDNIGKVDWCQSITYL